MDSDFQVPMLLEFQINCDTNRIFSLKSTAITNNNITKWTRASVSTNFNFFEIPMKFRWLWNTQMQLLHAHTQCTHWRKTMGHEGSNPPAQCAGSMPHIGGSIAWRLCEPWTQTWPKNTLQSKCSQNFSAPKLRTPWCTQYLELLSGLSFVDLNYVCTPTSINWSSRQSAHMTHNWISQNAVKITARLGVKGLNETKKIREASTLLESLKFA